jgi:hypothetical protein
MEPADSFFGASILVLDIRHVGAATVAFIV